MFDGFSATAGRNRHARRERCSKASDAFAVQLYNAMISRNDDSHCPLLYVACFGSRDFNFIGTRNSVAFFDVESFFVAAAA